MGFLDRKRRRLLPPDAAESLAEFGRAEFDPQSSPMPGTRAVTLISAFGFGELQENPDQAVQELYELGMRTGGWTLVGASYALRDFYGDSRGSTEYEELRDARLRFIHDQHLPNVHMHIAVSDEDRSRELFPSG